MQYLALDQTDSHLLVKSNTDYTVRCLHITHVYTVSQRACFFFPVCLFVSPLCSLKAQRSKMTVPTSEVSRIPDTMPEKLLQNHLRHKLLLCQSIQSRRSCLKNNFPAGYQLPKQPIGQFISIPDVSESLHTFSIATCSFLIWKLYNLLCLMHTISPFLSFFLHIPVYHSLFIAFLVYLFHCFVCICMHILYILLHLSNLHEPCSNHFI